MLIRIKETNHAKNNWLIGRVFKTQGSKQSKESDMCYKILAYNVAEQRNKPMLIQKNHTEILDYSNVRMLH